MTIYVVQWTADHEMSEPDAILTDEAEALAAIDPIQLERSATRAYLEETKVTCWRLHDGRYVKDETWPGERS